MKPPVISTLVLGMLLSLPAPAQEQQLGRLFFTPQQRAALDRQRQLNRGFQANDQQGENSLTINGEIRRSNGRSTRWINGSPEWDATAPAPAPVGDTFYPGTGERGDLLRGGSIRISPGSSK